MLNTTINQTTRKNTNQLLVPQATNLLEQMKYEIAQEMGIELSGDTSSRLNGMVGGEITKRLVALGQQVLFEKQNNSTTFH